MTDSPTTRATLLLKVRDNGDQTAWNQFVEIYAPLVHAYGRRRGLQDADASDLAQDVLQSVAAAVKSFEYDPSRGSFRGWLFTITLNKIRRMAGRNQREQASGESAVQEVLKQQPDEHSDEEIWNHEHRLRLFHWAADHVRASFQESTWQAFWMTAVEHRSAPEVAGELGLSTGAVYIAKSRVLDRIRRKIQTVEEDCGVGR